LAQRGCADLLVEQSPPEILDQSQVNAVLDLGERIARVSCFFLPAIKPFS
jgi:hypothetical protein